MIYFMQNPEGGPVKIGFSDDVGRRRDQLVFHYKQPLAVLAVIEGGRQEEREMHARFAHLQLSSRSGRGRKPELFHPDADLMEFVGCHLLVNQNPDAVEAMMPKTVLKAVRVEISTEMHRLLRRVAAAEDLSMAAYAKEKLEGIIREDAKRKEIK